MAVSRLSTPQMTEDANEAASWDYPTTADVSVMKGPNHTYHVIIYAGVPSTDFTKAPIASTLRDTLTGKLHTKTGAVDTDTWETVTSS